MVRSGEVSVVDATYAAKARLIDSDARFLSRPHLTRLLVDKHGLPDMEQPLILLDLHHGKWITIDYRPTPEHSIRLSFRPGHAEGTVAVKEPVFGRLAFRMPFDLVVFAANGEPLLDEGCERTWLGEQVLKTASGNSRSLQDGADVVAGLKAEAAVRSDAAELDYRIYEDDSHERTHLFKVNSQLSRLRRNLRSTIAASGPIPDVVSIHLAYSHWVHGTWARKQLMLTLQARSMPRFFSRNPANSGRRHS